MDEKFFKIPGSMNYYVSKTGLVRGARGKILKPGKTPKGYEIVSVIINGKRSTFGVHRLVAMTFIGSIDDMEVNHLNFNKSDNRVENLEIVTRNENVKHYVSESNSLRLAKNKIIKYFFHQKKWSIQKLQKYFPDMSKERIRQIIEKVEK